jgi:glycine C-acetyltransferase
MRTAVSSSLSPFPFFNSLIEIKILLKSQLSEIRAAGTYKEERIISSPQRMNITADKKEVINFCANNYLGLSDNPRVKNPPKKKA